MGWIESKSIGFVLPAFTDVFVDSETTQRLEPFGEVVGADEVVDVGRPWREYALTADCGRPQSASY